MKSIFFIIVLVTTNYSFTQGNLQFNQIISITNGGNLTVPLNKAWKIDAINFSEILSFPIGSLNNTSCVTLTANIPNSRQCYYKSNMLSIGGVNFETPSMSYVAGATTCGTPCPATNPIALSSTTYINNFIFPMWLNAGQNISVISGTGILISIVEFNIVP